MLSEHPSRPDRGRRRGRAGRIIAGGHPRSPGPVAGRAGDAGTRVNSTAGTRIGGARTGPLALESTHDCDKMTTIFAYFDINLYH